MDVRREVRAKTQSYAGSDRVKKKRKREVRAEKEREISLESGSWRDRGKGTERERDLGRINLANQTSAGYLTGSNP